MTFTITRSGPIVRAECRTCGEKKAGGEIAVRAWQREHQCEVGR